MGLFSGIGKALKSVGKVVGGGMKKLAPFASLIPGVGTLAGLGLGAGGSVLGDLLQGQGPDVSDALLSGGAGAAGGALLGGQGYKGAGGALKKLGSIGKGIGNVAGDIGGGIANVAKNTFTNDRGGLDLGKLAGIGLGGSALLGQRKESAKANEFNAANAKLRQQLMERILERPDYNFK